MKRMLIGLILDGARWLWRKVREMPPEVPPSRNCDLCGMPAEAQIHQRSAIHAWHEFYKPLRR